MLPAVAYALVRPAAMTSRGGGVQMFDRPYPAGYPGPRDVEREGYGYVQPTNGGYYNGQPNNGGYTDNNMGGSVPMNSGPPLKGALARAAARSAAAAAAAAQAQAAAAPPMHGEAASGQPPVPEEVRPRRPSTPKEATDGLQKMGARVIQPPALGSTEASWDALAGATDVKLEVEEVLVMPLRHPEAFASVRAGTRSLGTDRAAALLFYGPPGTGKTTAAKIAAAQAGLPLVYVPLEALMSKWFGKAEQQLAQLFDHCKALGRCVVFLDELDALAGSRSREIDDASRRMLSVLLRRLDGMEAQPDTTLIGATNRRADLDDALLSRFDVRVHFPAPEAAGRAEIFGLYAKHMHPEELQMLGDASVGLSGRDILDVCRQAERRWTVKLLKGEVTVPPLPPMPQYEETIRRRLQSGSDVKDDDAAAGRKASEEAAIANWRAGRRRVGMRPPQSIGPNSVGSWADRPLSEGPGSHWTTSNVRPPGW